MVFVDVICFGNADSFVTAGKCHLLFPFLIINKITWFSRKEVNFGIYACFIPGIHFI